MKSGGILHSAKCVIINSYQPMSFRVAMIMLSTSSMAGFGLNEANKISFHHAHFLITSRSHARIRYILRMRIFLSLARVSVP